jgi:D-lactate dehydrogenase (cytochrome)
VQDIMQAGIPVARIELLDALQMQACIAYSKLTGIEPAPTLLFEFHGSPAGVAEQAEAAEAIAADHAARGFAWATEPEARAKLWQARHDGYWANCALRPGWRILTTDCVVPISRLAEAVLGAQAEIARSGLLAPIVGHVGDGNFHTSILVPPEPDGLERALALDHAIVGRALDLEGSCSGEHGVGLTKREFLEREHGQAALEVMHGLKAALDPNGIMNPGKIFRD